MLSGIDGTGNWTFPVQIYPFRAIFVSAKLDMGARDMNAKYDLGAR